MLEEARHLETDVAEQLGHYVYALRDPRSAEVFYVGKGQGNRIFSHITESERHPAAEAAKNTRIRDIAAAGHRVEHLFLRIGLPSHADGLVVEQSVIDAFTAAGVSLTNIQGGHDSSTLGLATVDAVVARFSAPQAASCSEAIVMFIINKAWHPGMSAAEVYDKTRGHWRVGQQTRGRARYAFGVAHGVVRGVYRINSWFRSPKPGEDKRWGFEGIEDSQMTASYLGASVRHLVPERGAQNPVRRYLDGI